MARTNVKRVGAGRRPFGPFVRFAPDLLALEDRSVPAFIYVDPTFTGTTGGNPDQDFNVGGIGQAQVPAAQLTFVATATPAGAGGVTGAGKFAVPDLTTAFNSARDNPGEDTIVLSAGGTFALDNSQGKSLSGGFGGFNDNSYFFNTDPLSILGSGQGVSVIQPTVDTYDPADSDTLSDPVFAVRQGATFVGTDFAFDGAAGRFGVGIGVSGGTNATLTRVTVRNVVGEDGAATGGATAGVGVQVNPNKGGSVTVQNSTFSGNARVGVGFTDADGQVLGSSFTGRGAGDLVDYGVQALGVSNVYVSGNTITGYQGTASSDGTTSAGVLAAQDVDPVTGAAIPGGATLLAVGNSIVNNSFGVVVGIQAAGGADDSKAVVNFNDLSSTLAAAVGLDATAALAGPGVKTGVDAGIDGRNNFFGGTGPLRVASTGSNGDALLNPTGTGSAANGNVQIAGFRPVAVPATTVPSAFGTLVAPALADEVPVVRAAFFGPGVPLTIYVNGVEATFTPGTGTNPAQDFNPTGVGPLGTVAKGDLTFLPSGTPFGPGGVTAGGKYAVPDLATALSLARDNPGADVVNLSASGSPFALDNTQGQSTQNGGFNDNSFFFNASPLSILGSGTGQSVIAPTTSTVDTADPDSQSDPVLAARLGGSFTGSDFTLDGAGRTIGVGLGTSGGTSLTLTKVAVNNFVAESGAATNGVSFGFGVFVGNLPGAGGFVTVTDSSFTGNARVGLGLANANAQVLSSTFTGRGAGNFVDYGVQALGKSNVYVAGSTFTNFQGQAGADKSDSAAIAASQELDEVTGLPVGDGVTLLAAGNKITGNSFGVVLGTVATAVDTSKAVVIFNDLSGNAVALDATFSKGSGTTGTDSGIDGRFNFFGGTGPNRQAINPTTGLPNDTGATGDERLNPTGTGSQANGNVNINGFRGITVPSKVVPTGFGGPAGQTLPDATAVVIAAFAPPAVAANLIIYVNGAEARFTDAGADGKADQVFNPTNVGPLGTQPANSITFVAANTPFDGTFVVPADGKIAVPDITTAFNIARDNPGTDVIFLAASNTAYDLDNSQGQSKTGGFGGFNDNTYFFNDGTLTISGSGAGNSVIRPTAGTFDPADPDTAFDPVFAVRNGTADFKGSDFTLDGSLAKFGGAIGASGGTDVTLTRVAVRNFVGDDGSTTGGASSGYGLFVNNDAVGGLVSVVDSQFSGIGRIGVGLLNATAQVLGSTFTGRGAGNLVDYGVQASGATKVYVSGSTFTEFAGQASSDGTESAALLVTQDVDPATGVPVAGGASLLAVGNRITNNRVGVVVSNADATGTSTADVRFNDLSDNGVAINAGTGATAATATAPNNFFGPDKFATASPVVGAVTTPDQRPVTAPTLTITSGFGTAAAPALAVAAPAAAQAYVTDPRIQSPVSIALQGTQPVTGDVTFVATFTDVLVNQDKSLFTATYAAPGKAAQTFTSGQLVVSAPVTGMTGSTVTITVPAALLTNGPAGLVTLNLAPSSGSAGTGNAQLTVNGFQTAAASATAQFGAVNGGPNISPDFPAGVIVTPTSPATSTFAVTVAPGRTIASVVAVSNSSAVTVTRVAGSPDSAPQFTVSSASTAVGAATVTVTATDSDGLTDSTAFTAQFGVANGGVTLAPIGSLTFNTNGPAQTVGTTVTYSPGRTGTVTFSTSNPAVATIVQGGTSTNPTFTVTPVAGAVGSTTVTVTATDSDGISNSTAFGVQVGTGTVPSISGLPDTTIPFNGSTGPLTVNVAGVNQPLAVTATSSNPGVATVTITGTGATRTVVVTANPALTTGGSTAITLRVTDAQGISAVESFNVTVAPQRVRLLAAAAGPGTAPVVQTFLANGVKGFGFTAFELPFTGGVTVATGDVNGDGVDDIVAGANVGGGPRVRIIDGKTGAEIANFFAFEETFRGGVTVAVGKVLDTGVSAGGFFREQVIVGAGDGGGPRVSVFDINPVTKAATRTANFFAYESTFRNGASVAAGDLTGDGLAEIITGAGIGGGPRVRAFTAAGTPTAVDFFAFDSGYRGGVNVAAGLLDASGKASIVAGSGENNGSLVRVFGPTGNQQAQFAAYPDAGTAPKAVRVGVGQFTVGGPESILTGPGVGGGPLFKVFSGSNPGGGAIFQDFAFEQPFRGGIFVG